MHRGWVRLYRKIQDNPLWTAKKFTPGQAWVDLFLLANFKDSAFQARGVWITIKRGQLGWAIKNLGKRWQWSPGKVVRFLDFLASGDEPQIEYQTTNVTTLITIINYEEHQGDEYQTGEQTDTKRIPDGDQTETSKNDKKDKKVKKEYISPRLGEHNNVKLTQAELDKLVEHTGKEKALDLIERLSGYIASKGDKYKSHYATMLNWHRKDPSGAIKGTTPTMTPTQEAERNMLKNELSAQHQKLESKKEVPEGHPLYNAAQREIVKINERIDEIEAQLRELEG